MSLPKTTKAMWGLDVYWTPNAAECSLRAWDLGAFGANKRGGEHVIGLSQRHTSGFPV